MKTAQPTKRLPPRNIVVGCDEQSAVVRITDQKTLREIAKVVDFLPEHLDETDE